MDTKICTKCHQLMSISFFRTYIDKRNGRSKYRSQCNPCNIARIESIKAGMTAEEKKAYNRRIKLRNKYGIETHQYQELLDLQGGLCAICGCRETWKRASECSPLAVDHDHATGRIRGLLCIRCNLILGKAGDSTEILMKCVDYLNKGLTDGSLKNRERTSETILGATIDS